MEITDAEKYRKHAAAFQHSWMSNAKWRKVLSAIAGTTSNVTRCEFKCIDSDHITVVRAPKVSDIAYSHFADEAFQPFEYKWLEWMRFPRRFKPIVGVGYVVEQQVEVLKSEIEANASAMLSLDDQFLWLFAYTGKMG